LGSDWIDSAKFDSENDIVDIDGCKVAANSSGYKYELIAKKERPFSILERIEKIALALLAIVFSLGLALLSKSICRLFAAKEKISFGILYQYSDPNAGKSGTLSESAEGKDSAFCEINEGERSMILSDIIPEFCNKWFDAAEKDDLDTTRRMALYADTQDIIAQINKADRKTEQIMCDALSAGFNQPHKKEQLAKWVAHNTNADRSKREGAYSCLHHLFKLIKWGCNRHGYLIDPAGIDASFLQFIETYNKGYQPNTYNIKCIEHVIYSQLDSKDLVAMCLSSHEGKGIAMPLLIDRLNSGNAADKPQSRRVLVDQRHKLPGSASAAVKPRSLRVPPNQRLQLTGKASAADKPQSRRVLDQWHSNSLQSFRKSKACICSNLHRLAALSVNSSFF
jgi:hypothetical protein